MIIDPVLALMVTENGYDFSISRAPGKSDKHHHLSKKILKKLRVWTDVRVLTLCPVPVYVYNVRSLRTVLGLEEENWSGKIIWGD